MKNASSFPFADATSHELRAAGFPDVDPSTEVYQMGGSFSSVFPLDSATSPPFPLSCLKDHRVLTPANGSPAKHECSHIGIQVIWGPESACGIVSRQGVFSLDVIFCVTLALEEFVYERYRN